MRFKLVRLWTQFCGTADCFRVDRQNILNRFGRKMMKGLPVSCFRKINAAALSETETGAKHINVLVQKLEV